MTVESPAAHSPLRTPATLAVAGLWTMSVLSALRVLTAWSSGGVALVVSALVFAGSVYTAVTFIGWLYMAREALERRGDTGFRWATGWTIGGWFVPLANVVIPARVVGEVYARSLPGAVRGWRMPPLVTWWWVAFVFTSLRITYAERFDGVVHTHGVIFWTVVNGIAGCVAGVLGARIVRQITDAQAAWRPPQPFDPRTAYGQPA